jgi:holliday junction DNA helicase RuvA
VIGSVRGTVIERSLAGEVLVEVGGVGYRVLVPSGAVPSLAPGGPAFLFTHLHVREDAMVLFGFPTRDERDTFEVLIGASGVAMLSVHSPSALRRVLLDGDLDALTLVPGVGKRTAQKLMVLLQSRLDIPDLDLIEVESGVPSARVEVRAALTELGYGPDEVRAALTGLADDQPAEDLLRAALRQLAVRT